MKRHLPEQIWFICCDNGVTCSGNEQCSETLYTIYIMTFWLKYHFFSISKWLISKLFTNQWQEQSQRGSLALARGPFEVPSIIPSDKSLEAVVGGMGMDIG